MKIKLSDYELGWIVGVLEGEGYFAFTGTQRIAIEMVDYDTMLAVALVLGKITGKEVIITSKHYSKKANSQESFQIQLSGIAARDIMHTVVSHMGIRRRARIWQALNSYTEPKPKSLKELGFDITKFITEKVEANERDHTDRTRSTDRSSGSAPTELSGSEDAGGDDQERGEN